MCRRWSHIRRTRVDRNGQGSYHRPAYLSPDAICQRRWEKSRVSSSIWWSITSHANMKTVQVPRGTFSGPSGNEHTNRYAVGQSESARTQGDLETQFLEIAAATDFPSHSGVSHKTLSGGSHSLCFSRGPDDLQRWREIAKYTTSIHSAEHEAPIHSGPPEFVPAFRGFSVSAFTEWLMECHGVQPNWKRQLRGRAAESSVRWSRVPVPRSDRWELIHDGMHRADAPGEAVNHFRISALKINGRALSASPDLVFRRSADYSEDDVQLREIVIVEVKCTDADVPVRTWANVRAQLWAYSLIDEFRSAAEVSLIAEVWNASGTERRCTTGWRRSSQLLEAEFRPWFQRYASLPHRSWGPRDT